MGNKELITSFIDVLQSEFREKLDSYLFNILKEYSFEEEVKWRYEYFENENYNYHSFGISFIFVRRYNEDNYGFDISFKILCEAPSIVTTYIARGNGSMIIDEKRFELIELSSSKQKLDDLIYEYQIVSGLLIKEYILECTCS